MDAPTPQPDHVSSQHVVERPARPIAQRTIVVRVNPRLLAALGAGTIVLGAFLPWIQPEAQAALSVSHVAPVVQGWPSLLIGLIALGALLLPHADSSRWVSVPAAALGLAAAVIAVASAVSASNAVAAAVAQFPEASVSIVVTGPGVIVTVAGGLLCLVAGLSRPPGASPEAQAVIRLGDPAFAVLASLVVLIALAGALIGGWIASSGTGQPDGDTSGVPGDLLSTPVIDVQVTPLGVTEEPTPEVAPTLETPAVTAPPTGTLPPTATEPPIPTPPPSPTTELTSTLTPTPTATTGVSLLPTP
jgi:hypothetical protein